MNVLIVYCHPSANSFTRAVKDSFLRGLSAAGHDYAVSDLYEGGFRESFSEKEYRREAYYDSNKPLDADVLEEQRKIQSCDALVFIYPVFWTEAPAKLVGWFQRVWTYGFAYGDAPQMKQLKKALFLVSFGGNAKERLRQEQIGAMKTVMIGDRIGNRAKTAEMIVFDETARLGNGETRKKQMDLYLDEAYLMGYHMGDDL